MIKATDGTICMYGSVKYSLSEGNYVVRVYIYVYETYDILGDGG